MSIFTRIKNIFRYKKAENTPQVTENPYEDTSTGDIIQVDLEDWLVTGKVVYFDPGHAPHRYAYYLQSGSKQACLIVETGRSYEFLVAKFVEGALDNPNNVPTTLNVGNNVFRLEYTRKDKVAVSGNTDFRSDDRIIFWRYIGKGDSYFLIQWQDGKFVAMSAERTPANGVRFMRASGNGE